MTKTFVHELFNIYYSKYEPSYAHLNNLKDLEFISFTYGIIIILKALKIDSDKINIGDTSLESLIKDIIKSYLKEDLKLTDEEKLYAFLYDKNNVNI